MSKARKKSTAQQRRQSPTRVAGHEVAPDWLIVALAGFGMLITAYLTGTAWLDDSPAFCAAGSGCDVVRQSQWSSFLGLPMSLWGFAVYALLGLMTWRMPPRLKRWRRLWMLALVGVAVSVYLTVVGLIALDAACPWCLLSLATISAIFASLVVRRPASAPGVAWSQWALQSSVVTVVLVAFLHAWYSGLFTHPDTPRLQALAAHLDQDGAKFYGAWWCPACQEQKRMFGGAGESLPFIECSTGGRGTPMRSICSERGIESYPTWIINGRRYTGALPPQELARYAGFDWAEPR